MFVSGCFGFVTLANGQVFFSGPCPNNVNVEPDFDVARYLGEWYEYAKYPAVFEANGKCNTAEYTLQTDGNVHVHNSMINEKNGQPDDIDGYAQVISNAKLLVTFPLAANVEVSSNYWVLGTDYDSYSVVYSCVPYGRNLHSVIAWILTRERVPSDGVVSQAKDVLTKNGLRLRDLIVTTQSGCN